MKATRKTLLALIGAMAVGAAVAAPSVEIVSVQQQYPWTNTVDIVYNVAGVASETNGYFVAFTPTTQAGQPIEDINGETSIRVALSCTTNGAVAQWFPQTNQQYTACKMTPAVYRGGSGGGNDYMIVDLLTGAVTYEPMATQEASNQRYNTDEYKTTKMVFRRVEAGTYDVMEGKGTAYMAKDYYMGIFELTVGQYNAIMGSGSSSSTVAKSAVSWNSVRGSALSVARVSESGNGLIGKLNAKVHALGNAALYFDLPTEAMWEVACRAKCPASWCRYYGTTASTDETGIATHAWWKGNSKGGVQSVGKMPPNDWGFYDMLGNVWEYCRDTVEYKADDPNTLDTASLGYTQTPYNAGNRRPIRGGCMNDVNAGFVRCSARPRSRLPTATSSCDGFRLSMIVD